MAKHSKSDVSVLRFYAAATTLLGIFTSVWLFACPQYKVIGNPKVIDAKPPGGPAYQIDYGFIDGVRFWAVELIAAAGICAVAMWLHASLSGSKSVRVRLERNVASGPINGRVSDECVLANVQSANPADRE